MVASIQLLRDHVERFNAGVRSGSFAAMTAHLADDAEMRFEGVSAGPFVGRTVIEAAYSEQPPDDEIVLLDATVLDDERVVGSYAWSGAPDALAGRLRLRVDGDVITHIVVTFVP